MSFKLNTGLRALQRNFERFLSRKISNRLLITYIMLGALPLVIASLLLISLTQDTVQSYIHERNRETARRASNEISLFVKEPFTILQTTALTPDLLERDVFTQTIINKIKDEHGIFSKVFMLNDSGLVTATTEFGEEFQNFSNEPFFLETMLGSGHISDIYFSPSRFPLLTIAEPIQKFNQVAGVLAAEIDLKTIWTLVDSITIGKTGFAFLLSADGQVIAHRDKDKVFRREDFSTNEFFTDLITNQEDFVTYLVEGEESILVYERIPQLNWGVVVQQSQTEAFTLASQMQSRVLYFTMLTVLIAIVLGILSIQRLTQPLLQLVRGVREYASGNLEHQIEMKTQDELAELAQEFNSMAGSLKKNQRELQRMERLAALSRFASLVSHEIRNPLNSMNINMQILKRSFNRPEISPERKTKYLDVISSEITRINDLVTNFLTIARPPELNLIRTDLHQILDEVIIIQKAHARSEGVKIRRGYASDTVTGMFDYNQLKQVFHNIIINAVEAIIEEGMLSIKSKVIEKKVSETDMAYMVRIEFKDNGMGIPGDIITEVFEFYHTTKRTGSGLGLAIAKQIIEGHKGSIYIKSKVGGGTSVFIELPIDKPCPKEQNDAVENKELDKGSV